MEIGLREILDILQTIAIILTLSFSSWQWKKNRDIIKIDNYAKIINSMNNLRDVRIQFPDLERALFKSRDKMEDKEIRKRVYCVELANIFELAFLSHEKGLIDQKEWDDWSSMWKKVILSDESMRTMMEDETIYTFSVDAYNLVKGWIEGIKIKNRN